MNPMPDMPPGCEIAAAPDAAGVTLSWPAYKPATGWEYGAGGLLFWLCLWTAGGLTALAVLVSGKGHPFLVLWLCGWAAGEWFAVVKLRELFRPPTPESVRLEANALKYDPGTGPREGRSCAELPDGKVVPVVPAPATEVGRAAVRGFGIDSVSGRERLYFDRGAHRVEIGGCLSASERAWLFAVLRDWFGEPRPAPAWSRGGRRGREGATS